MTRFATCFCAVVLVAACARPAPAPAADPRRPGWRVGALEAPAMGGSGEPNLAAAADGRIFLTWIETAAEGVARLRLASRRAGEAWSTPTTIAAGAGLFVNWADFPSLVALPGGALVAHWLTKNSGGGHGYDVRVSVSRDAGWSWSPPIVPHRDATPTEHGFVSLLPWSSAVAGVFWLDGRAAAGRLPADADMQLVHTTVDAAGDRGPEIILDTRVCDCCQTAAVRTDRGALVVYRDRSPTELRDISIVRYEEGRWSEPQTLHADGWEMNGCPVNGPAVAALGRHIAVAWFTAAHDEPEVKLLVSNDSGRSFGTPIRVDDGRPVGRVDVALLPDGEALVSWIEQTTAGAELRVRQSGGAGPRRPSLMVADSSSARSSGFPRLELAGDEPVLAWRALGEPGRVATATLEAE